ncbi:jg6667 [Pararge aegeria aegeria]|uniref:glycerol kinase n=1 Tax=Pararge aegeria aegeria TaxID=348720 RepID=A0A8S4SI25_9NEOP|nr:jg6667 [Pararge aegeria aegeria]
MGISTQRSTFITWSRETGKPFHRFITWKDLRADELVKQWNDSYTWRLIKVGSYVLYMLSRSKRFRAGSVLKFTNNQTTMRLSWVLHNIQEFKSAVQSNDAMFGTLDTWLLYKMTVQSSVSQPPYNDFTAASGFVGMKPSTTKAHLVRAVLESLAFRTAQLYTCVQAETTYNFSTIRLDGGVSNNDFVVQLVADLTGLKVERPVQVEMSSLGCAHIVGLQLGIFKSKDELKSLRKIGTVFSPRPQVKKSYEKIVARWEDAVKRMCGWYLGNKSSQNSVQDSSNSVTPQNSFKATKLKRNSSNT